MKTYIIIAIIGLSSPILNAQYGRQIGIEDIGNAFFNEVKNSESIKPCQETPGKSLIYCVEDGSKITYLFKNYKLSSIVNSTAFLLKSDAEAELKKEVNLQTRKTGIRPAYVSGMAIFNSPNSDISLSFSVTEIQGTYYLVTAFSAR